METKTIVETTTQVSKEYGVYDITIHSLDGVVIKISADVIAQVTEQDENGGYFKYGKKVTLVQEKGDIDVVGTIPSDVLLGILEEFDEIVNNLNNN